MKHEDNFPENNEPSMQPWIEPELEARVVAWVAGEASPFEAAELERLCAEKPELAIFKRRVEAVQGLVADAVRPENEPLRMAPERREKLLATIGSAADEPVRGAEKVAVLEPRRKRWWLRPGLVAAAACVPLAGLVAVLTLRQDEAPARPEPMTAAPGPAPAASASSTAPAEGAVHLQAFEVRNESKLSRAVADMKRRLFSADEARQAGASTDAAKPLELAVPQAPATASSDAPALEPRSADFAPASSRVNSLIGPVTLGDTLKADANMPTQQTPQRARTVGQVTVDAAAGGARTDGALGTAGNLSLSKDVSSTGSLALGAVVVGGALANDASVGTAQTAQAQSPVFLQGDNREASAPRQLAVSEAATSKLTGAKAELDTAKKRDTDPAPPPRPAAPASAASSEETSATREPVSTFSLHVSDVSFRLAHAALMRGEMPEAARIRPEEFYNAFNYGDVTPAPAEQIGARIEQAAHPFLQQRNFLRIAMKVPATGRAAATPLRLTVLLDTSGSMEREDRVAAVRRALRELIALLGPNDRITLIGFARQPRLLAENIAGNQAGWLLDLIARTPAEGGTNVEEALKLGSELARRHQLVGAQNRIVMLTDGAANLGNANPEQLATAIEGLRQQGIAFDACGVGLEGLDDTVLEALTRKGDGRYYVLNSSEAAGTGFARQIAGALRPAAENVKLQVRFNPARVGRYRLIGFEQHRLQTEDFRNDRVDAAELAAEEAAVALYQIEVLPQGAGDVGEVFVRFRDTSTGNMVERSWPIAFEPRAPAFDGATPTLQLAGTAALLAEKLRGGANAEHIRLRELAPVVNALRGYYANEPRVQELVAMFTRLRQRIGD